MTTVPPDGLDDALAAWFESIGGRMVAIGTTVEDVEGRYRRWFADHGVAAALERPDFAVYGTASSGRDIPALLTRLRRELETPHAPSGASKFA